MALGFIYALFRRGIVGGVFGAVRGTAGGAIIGLIGGAMIGGNAGAVFILVLMFLGLVFGGIAGSAVFKHDG